MFNPISTYRIQFHKDFNFQDLASILPYLAKLGIGSVYASPVFSSVKGSTHGYDGTDPSLIDPEIGTEDELVALRSFLDAAKIGWVQDIVPNHQAFDLSNPWLSDLLEKGPESSQFADYFDIDWQHPLYPGKLMLPFLGEPLDKLYEDKQVKIAFKDERYQLQVVEAFYPLNTPSIENINASALEAINSDTHELKKIEDAQFYKLSYWEDSDSQLNFRRFFTVNGLISLNIQDNKVFEEFHEKLLQYTRQGLFDGLRIDHIDGLYDPAQYLGKLRKEIGDDKYLVVEKILQQDEKLPDWPVEGSSGYDFLAQVNNLFTFRKNKAVFRKKYAKFTGEHEDPAEMKLDKKRKILHKHMAGDLDNLFRLFSTLDPGYMATLTVQESLQIKAALGEMLVEWPVYRLYPQTVADEDLKAVLSEILETMERKLPDLQKTILQLRDMFLIRNLGLDEGYNQKLLQFLRRCMQYTGPLTAKGVEDTLMYTYHPFLGHNEVGDDVEAFGIEAEEFHNIMLEKSTASPLSMNATSTHDTKRGEDSRARLNLLSEIPGEWFNEVKNWRKINAEAIIRYNIHPNDEYFIYQSIYGAYPFPGENESGFLQRMQEYFLKALREGKSRTNWNNPDLDYEKNVNDFLAVILNKEGAFFDAFHEFFVRTVDFGIINSLSQVILKMTCPGLPDVYQGTELWDLSLVDPDNRTAVDYALRSSALSSVEKSFAKDVTGTLKTLWEEKYNGHIKLFLTTHLLRERKNNPEVFEKGTYIPLKVKGKYSDFLLAFARVSGDKWMITVVPRFNSILHDGDIKSFEDFDWKNTRVMLPVTAPGQMKTLFDENWKVHDGTLLASDLFEDFPVNLIELQPAQQERNAGVLLAITSLPSRFGTGDLGPAAYAFADQLSRSRQRLWQILPVNPVSAGSGYAPYSSYSSMAGNTLLISPEMLVRENLLLPAQLEGNSFEVSDQADFPNAEAYRKGLFIIAWETFKTVPSHGLKEAFGQFCQDEAAWLDDHALFFVVKSHRQQQSWTDWEKNLKDRDFAALENFSITNSDEIEQEKFLQFIFYRQFAALKQYCAGLKIKLIGDLPFYVSQDSVDVWANRELFNLDEQGNMLGVAGVPPDYFNEDGQLWGMPVFNWEELKKSDYSWWLHRIKRNLELVDLLRLDHFRAFAGFWSVDAADTTARNGRWIPGPGADFFSKLKEHFPGMPFIAEDLGEISPDVYKLRDDFALPGMRVLQFSFGGDLGISVNSPHNYVADSFAYTGTHDNNTTKGWFRKDASRLNRKNLSDYFGAKVKEKNIGLVMTRSVYASVSKTVILPMQDILDLDESARMNTPAVTGDQWLWRMLPNQFSGKYEEWLANWVRLYNRG